MCRGTRKFQVVLIMVLIMESLCCIPQFPEQVCYLTCDGCVLHGNWPSFSDSLEVVTLSLSFSSSVYANKR